MGITDANYQPKWFEPLILPAFYLAVPFFPTYSVTFLIIVVSLTIIGLILGLLMVLFRSWIFRFFSGFYFFGGFLLIAIRTLGEKTDFYMFVSVILIASYIFIWALPWVFPSFFARINRWQFSPKIFNYTLVLGFSAFILLQLAKGSSVEMTIFGFISLVGAFVGGQSFAQQLFEQRKQK